MAVEEVTSEPTQMADVAVSQEQEEPFEDATDDAATTEDVKVAEQNGELNKNDQPKTGEELVDEKKIDGEAVEASSSTTTIIVRSGTFKEESNLLSDLKEPEKAALIELRSLLEDAILGNTLFKEPKESIEEPEKAKSSEKLGEKDEKTSEGEEVEKQSESGKEKEGSLVKVGKEEPNATEEESTTKEQKPAYKVEEGEEKEKINECNEKESTNHPAASGIIIEERRVEEVDKEISLWGVPLLPSKGDKRTCVILLKFLRAREFNVNEAFEMLRTTLQWRKEFDIDSVLDEDLGTDLNSSAYTSGVDREGHPVCYNYYGVFGDGEIYNKTLGSEERREKFLRWRSQVMERRIQKLDFKPAGVSSLLQINDLKNIPGPGRKELRLATKQAVGLLQDNYPELVARNIFINVPFWCYAFSALLTPFLTQRTKSKFVFVRSAKVTDTLLKYIAAEEISMQYGGLKRDDDCVFSIEDEVLEVTVKAGSTETIEIPAPEVGTTLVWDLTVSGWEVNYKEEYVPEDEGSYTLIVQKGRKMGWQEGSIRNSFTNREPGKVVLTVENGSYKKKRILYRYKTKNSSTTSSSLLVTA